MATKRKYLNTFRVPADETQPLKYWQATLELKPHPNGDRRRKFIRSKDRDKAERLYTQAIKDKDASGGDLPTRGLTVAEWIQEWFTTIAVLDIKPKTAHTYEGLIRREILPTIGTIRLERLTTRDVRLMLATVTGKGLSSTTAQQVHRILAVALKHAVNDGHIPRNVASMVPAPRKAHADLTALDLEEGMKVLETATGDPWGSLWWAVLLTGQRQGELLGLEIDRVTDVLDISWQLQRLTWQHGCTPPCGRKRGADCRERKITAPADWRSRHLTGGLWLTAPKTTAATRIIPLVEPLKSIIEAHIALTAAEPNPHGLVWRMPDGSPVDPRVESEAWHNLLKRAGVPDIRLHDGRHTTVDLLLEAGVDIDVVREIVGHSARETTMKYKSRKNINRRIDAMTALSTLLTQPSRRAVDAPSPAALEQ